MAKTKRTHELAAGIFVLLALATVFVVLILVSDLGGFFESKRSYRVIFTVDQNIEGLQSGAAVKLGGYKIGNVTSVRPEPLGGTDGKQWQLLVEIDIPRKYVLHKKDLAVELVRPLLGVDATLNIANVGTGEPVAEDETITGMIASAPFLADAAKHLGFGENEREAVRQAVAHLKNLIASLERSGVEIETLLTEGGDIRHIIGRVKLASEKFPDIVENANATLTSIRGMFGEDGQVMKIAAKLETFATEAVDILKKNRKAIDAVIANAERFTGESADGVAELRKQLQPILAKVDTALTTANDALKGFQDLSATAESLMKRNEVPIGAMIDDYRIMAGNLKATSAEIRANPWRLLYQPTEADKKKAVLNDAARNFAAGAGQVKGAAQVLAEALAAAKDESLTDDPAVRAAMTTLNDSIANFRKVERFLLKETARN